MRYPSLTVGFLAVSLSVVLSAQKQAFGQAESCQDTPIAVTVTQGLQFGRIVPCTSTGTVTIEPSGMKNTTGCLSVSGGAMAANIVVSDNQPGRHWIVVQINPAATNLQDGGETAPVNDFNIKVKNGGPTWTKHLDGTTTVPVGATLTVGPNKPEGSYTGAFTVTAFCQ